MSLAFEPIPPVPPETVRVAKAAFPKGNLYLTLRDELGPIFGDADFANLFSKTGQPAIPPWQLALVTVMQFRENLSDRQAADAVRSRIDWKYLLGLELAKLPAARTLLLMPQPQYEALKAARATHASTEGQQRYKRRAGIEGTLSQGVRAFGLRQTRYRGLTKTHLQNTAVAPAMNFERLVNWVTGVPRAKTRVSRFAALVSD